jgi:hypothetical protein
MFPSKINPTTSPFRFIIGDPEFPPMISVVVTKLNGVERTSLSLPSHNASASRKELCNQSWWRDHTTRTSWSCTGPRPMQWIAHYLPVRGIFEGPHSFIGFYSGAAKRRRQYCSGRLTKRDCKFHCWVPRFSGSDTAERGFS